MKKYYKKRQKMSKKSSRKSFKRGAVRVNKRNFSPGPMRGGIRL